MAFPPDEMCAVPGLLRRRTRRERVGSLSGQKFDRAPLGVTWIHGSSSAEGNADPAVQVHWHDPHTVLLRQSKAVHYEAPFLYLMFGARRAVLVDTGAT